MEGRQHEHTEGLFMNFITIGFSKDIMYIIGEQNSSNTDNSIFLFHHIHISRPQTPVLHTKVFILTWSSRSRSGYWCLWEYLWECLCNTRCWSGAAGDTSWVGCPLAITPTHCCHLSLWNKPWVTLKHHHWAFCSVCVRLHRSIDWRGWGSTVSCMIEVTVTMGNYQSSS